RAPPPCGGGSGQRARAPPGPPPRQPALPTWSSGSSPRSGRTSCGWLTSPTCEPSPAGRTRRSSSTSSRGWSSAGRWPPPSTPPSPWTRWRWPAWRRRHAGGDLSGLVHHSDRGVQYRAIRYTERLEQGDAVASVGSRGDSYDNALAEAFNSLFKAELVRNKGPWTGVNDLEVAVAEYIY